MAIKNLVYDLNPDEIFNIFTRDYDKYTKEEINDLILFLVDKSDNYVKAEKLVDFCEDMKNEVSKVEGNGSYIFSSYNLDTFVYNLSKFLYESTHVNANEPIIIDENVYTNYLNYLGNDGVLFETRLEMNYIFNSCIHSKVGSKDLGNISSELSNYDGLTPYFFGLFNFYFNNDNESIFDNSRIYPLPVYLELFSYDGASFGWINNFKFSKVAGYFIPDLLMSLGSESDFNKFAYKSQMTGGHFDFSTGKYIDTTDGSDYITESNPLGFMSPVVSNNNSFILNCKLPNYIFKAYIDEGGIFERTDAYFRDSSIWDSGHEENFPIITEYNPVDADKSIMATVKFGESELWKMPGVLIEEDKDFMQIIKKKDIKYQGDIQWMINNFYISKFVFIPDIYIFIKMLYNHNDGEDETIKAFKNVVNNVRIGEEPLETLITFILSAYILTYKDIEYYSETEEYQQLMDLESNVGIINYIINVDMGKLTYDSWGKHFFGDNILKNISLENYNVIDGGKPFELFTNTILLTDDFGADFGVAEDCNFGIPDIFWEGSELNGYHLDTLLEQPNYRCSFFYKDDDNFFHIVFINKGTSSVKYKDLIIYKKNSRVFGFIENLAFNTDDLSSDMSTEEYGDYVKMKHLFYEGYQNFDKYNVLIGDEIENNWAMVINDIDFSINVRSNNYVEVVPSNYLQYEDLEVIDVREDDNYTKTIVEDFTMEFKKWGEEIDFSDVFTKVKRNNGEVGNIITDISYTQRIYPDLMLLPANFYDYYKWRFNDVIWEHSLIEMYNDYGIGGLVKTHFKFGGIRTNESEESVLTIFVAEYDSTLNDSENKLIYKKSIVKNIENYNTGVSDELAIPEDLDVSTSVQDSELLYPGLFLMNINNIKEGNVRKTIKLNNSNDYIGVDGFVVEKYTLKVSEFYDIPEDFDDIKLLPKKILKKDDVKLLDQDITNVTVEGLEKSFHDWDNAPLYMIKTRYGKKDNSIVKSNFLEKTLNDIRETNFIFVQNDVDEITPIDPTVEEDR